MSEQFASSQEKVKEGLEISQAKFKEGVEVSQAKVKEGMEKAIRTTEDLVAFGQDNIAAFLKSSQILSTGLQDLSKQLASTAQASLDEAVSTFKALSGVKSLKEAVDLQASVAKANLEKALAESGKAIGKVTLSGF